MQRQVLLLRCREEPRARIRRRAILMEHAEVVAALQGLVAGPALEVPKVFAQDVGLRVWCGAMGSRQLSQSARSCCKRD